MTTFFLKYQAGVGRAPVGVGLGEKAGVGGLGEQGGLGGLAGVRKGSEVIS